MAQHLAAALVLTLSACSTARGVGAQQEDLASSDSNRFAGVVELLETSVRAGVFPGAVLAAGISRHTPFIIAVGRYGQDDPRMVRDSTIYDLASLTKVVGLTTAAMILVAEGRLDLEQPVQSYLTEFRGAGKEHVLIRHLLTHTSGLPAWRPLHLETSSSNEALDTVLTTALEGLPGERYVYSDLGAITLGVVVERITGQPLDAFLQARVFRPLGMAATRYRPPASWHDNIAPTEHDPWRGRVLRGEVHDENAARLGGVAGHAGLFSMAPDLVRFATWMLDAYHARLPASSGLLVPAETVRAFVARQPGPTGSTRALGWDTPSATGSSAGTLFSRSSFGHTGFTGTSIWIDPERELYVILLSNRVHPTRENNAIRGVRGLVADSVFRALFQ